MEARRRVPLVERTAWLLGVIGLAGWGTFHVGVGISTRQDLERFAALRSISLPAGTPETALSDPVPVPLAVLRIPKIRLAVPVLPGTGDRTLDRAVGHIEGTPEPGADGNSGIAGHRDSFFRGLKDIVPGDAIELDTRQGQDIYRVERTWVVDPEEVWVLDATSTRALTLVTCYPFYYVGSAPRRFIVRAVLADDNTGPSPSRTARAPCVFCGGWRVGFRSFNVL